MAYEMLEPDPAEWTMQLMAQLLALTANLHRDPKARARPYAAADFLPQEPSPVDAEQSWADTLAEMRAGYAERNRPN